jgi:hypothetical protein
MSYPIQFEKDSIRIGLRGFSKIQSQFFINQSYRTLSWGYGLREAIIKDVFIDR